MIVYNTLPQESAEMIADLCKNHGERMYHCMKEASVIGTRLGEGSLSTCWTSPLFPGYVAKTNGMTSYDSHQNDGQGYWIQWCAENQNNPYVPKILFLWIDWDESNDGTPLNRFFVIQEQLYPFQNHNGSVFASDFRCWVHKDTRNQFMPNVQRFEQVSEHNRFVGFRSPCDRTILSNQLFESLKHVSYNLEDLECIKSGIHSTAKISGGWYDLHPGNFMLREDGTPVVCDPII